jgi:hypothetical protein
MLPLAPSARAGVEGHIETTRFIIFFVSLVTCWSRYGRDASRTQPTRPTRLLGLDYAGGHNIAGFQPGSDFRFCQILQPKLDHTQPQFSITHYE